MRAVWKYQLPNGPAFQLLQIPAGGQILRVEAQQGVPMMWVLVDPDAPLEGRGFDVVMTGSLKVFPTGIYIGTVQLFDGSFVLHYFEVAQR